MQGVGTLNRYCCLCSQTMGPTYRKEENPGAQVSAAVAS